MKRIIPILLLAVMLTGCNEPKHVSGAEFKREFELNNQQTLSWAEYLGQKDGKAFLLRKRVPLVGEKVKKEVWYTEAKNLDADFLKQIEGERAKLEQAAAPDAQKPARP